MFTWICPQCGAEVPPAYSDCPNCKPIPAEPPKAPVQAAAPAPPPRVTARTAAPPTPTAPPVAAAVPIQPVAPPPPPPAVAPQYTYPPPPRRQGVPPWLATIGVFAGLSAAGYAYYTLVLNKNGAAATSAEAPAAEVPASTAAGAPKGGRNRDLSKHLEAAGIRIVETNRQPTIRLMLVNHSNVEMAGLAGTIALSTGTQNELAAIPFTLASLGPYEAKDISAPLKTKLRAYELPDWQFIKAQVRLNPQQASE